jgi:hypothetical protein
MRRFGTTAESTLDTSSALPVSLVYAFIERSGQHKRLYSEKALGGDHIYRMMADD